MINIPKNDYIQPTEVREWVVQGICEAFLSDNGWSTFYPYNDGAGRYKRKYIARHTNNSRFYGFVSERFTGEECVEFHGEEMKRAFEELHKAGYFIFRIYTYGTWMGYVCKKKPFLEGCARVKWFEDFID